MKKTILTISALAAFACGASAQTALVAGWQFDNTVSFADNTTSSLTINADKTQVGALTDGDAPSIGSFTISYDDNLYQGDVDRVSGSLNSGLNGSVTGRDPLDPFQTGNGKFIANSITEYSIDAVSMLFEVDTDGAEFFNDWKFSFAAEATGSITTAWTYSTNGVDYSSFTGATTSISGADALYTFDIANVSSDQLYLQLDLAGLNSADTNQLVFDNVALSGTVVPEPSSFAALAGVLALGYVGVRRRRS